MTTPEGRIKKLVKDELRARGVWYFMPTTGGFGKSGVPDIVGCLRGRFVGIECKAPGKRSTVTELQKMRLQEIAAAGGFTAVVDSVSDLRDLLDTWELAVG